MKLLDKTKAFNGKVSDIVEEIRERFNYIFGAEVQVSANSKESAKDRLQLVLTHDRSKLAPGDLEKMRDELVEVIAKYVNIDKEALDLNLQDDSGAIALVANIPVARGNKQRAVTEKSVVEETNSEEDKETTEEVTESEDTTECSCDKCTCEAEKETECCCEATKETESEEDKETTEEVTENSCEENKEQNSEEN